MNWEALDLTILGPAFVAGLLVVSTHVPLGRRVLARGIIFLDLALAQIAGLGLIAAHSFDWEPGGWQVQAVALASALLGAVLLHQSEKRWPEIQEALIGSLFVLASSGGILLLASNPHGGEHLKELLVGQVLWVGYEQLLPVALLYVPVLGAMVALRRHRSSLPFYLLFALSITASVQLVGVYLVFATLILPALAVRRQPRYATAVGYLVGLLGYALGLALAALLDLPAGATVVYTLALCALLTAWLSRRAQTVPSPL
ncbi:MAG: metal ABC transporter permease [Pseudomonadota bacterium]